MAFETNVDSFSVWQLWLVFWKKDVFPLKMKKKKKQQNQTVKKEEEVNAQWCNISRQVDGLALLLLPLLLLLLSFLRSPEHSAGNCQPASQPRLAWSSTTTATLRYGSISRKKEKTFYRTDGRISERCENTTRQRTRQRSSKRMRSTFRPLLGMNSMGAKSIGISGRSSKQPYDLLFQLWCPCSIFDSRTRPLVCRLKFASLKEISPQFLPVNVLYYSASWVDTTCTKYLMLSLWYGLELDG